MLRASLESLAASLQPQHSRLEAPNPWQQAAAPQLGSCASSGRTWRLQAARHSSQGGRGAGPLGAPPLPRLLERAASKAADPT